MNSNYYNNMYGYPYYPQQQNYYGNQQQVQQPTQQITPQQVQQNVIPMVYVNGLVGAKSYWMGTNQIAYLRDSEDDTILYEKKTDNVGKFYLKAYKLTEMELDNNGGFTTGKQANDLQILNAKIDKIYSILVPAKETNVNEQQQL